MEEWYYGTTGLWDYGSMVLWDYRTMGLWNYGTMRLWNYGTINLRSGVFFWGGERRREKGEGKKITPDTFIE